MKKCFLMYLSECQCIIMIVKYADDLSFALLREIVANKDNDFE